eukprot:gene7818-8665_t
MAAKGTAKDPPSLNYVHQNDILLYTLTGKPNSAHDSADGEEDDAFLKVIKRAHETPVEKFAFPQTEAQEIGWMNQPLIKNQRKDPRLHHPRSHSEITTFMDAYWRQKEQSENLN